MYQNNICRFIPFHKDYHSIHTINYVMETQAEKYDSFRTEAVYKAFIVCDGDGYIHTTGKIHPLATGDIFFTFPACPYKIQAENGLKFMYISFIGSRGNMIFEKLGITGANFIFNKMNELLDMWKNGLLFDSSVSELISESVLLYTFATLGRKILPEENSRAGNDTVSAIKKCIDDNFSTHSFGLEDISRELSYNKKYISTVFKKNIGVGIVDYINTVRIQQACTMAGQGYTCVGDIADKCGFSDAQYFSRVFKAKMGMSPGQYIRSLKKQK